MKDRSKGIKLLNKLENEFYNAGYNHEIQIKLDDFNDFEGKNYSAIILIELSEIKSTMAFKDLNDYFNLPYKIDILINSSMYLVDMQFLFTVPYFEYNPLDIRNIVQTLINPVRDYMKLNKKKNT